MYMADNVHILHKLYTRAHWCIIKAPINILMLYHVDFSMAFIPYYRSNKLQSSWNFYSVNWSCAGQGCLYLDSIQFITISTYHQKQFWSMCGVRFTLQCCTCGEKQLFFLSKGNVHRYFKKLVLMHSRCQTSCYLKGFLH